MLQRKLRENAENQQMIIEEEASWAFAAHERARRSLTVAHGANTLVESEHAERRPGLEALLAYQRNHGSRTVGWRDVRCVADGGHVS